MDCCILNQVNQGYFVGNWNRFYIVSEKGKIIGKRTILGNNEKLCAKISQFQSNIFPDEIKDLITESEKKGLNYLFVEQKEQVAEIAKISKLQTEIGSSQVFKRLKRHLFSDGINDKSELAVSYAYFKIADRIYKSERIIQRLITDHDQLEHVKRHNVNILRDQAIFFDLRNVEAVKDDEQFIEELFAAFKKRSADISKSGSRWGKLTDSEKHFALN